MKITPHLHFDVALAEVRDQFLQIGENAKEIIDLAVRSYFREEPSLTSDAISLRSEGRRATKQIDEILVKLASNRKLTCADTRRLMAYIKINVNLESINALAFSTADLSFAFFGPKVPLKSNIPELGLATARQLELALHALAREDCECAATVIDAVGALALTGNEAWLMLVDETKACPEVLKQALNALMIVRNLETIAEHAKSIAESVFFSANVVYGISLEL